MQVLVAGATGRVGKALIKRLVDEGYDVIAAARRENAVEVVDPEHVTVQHLDFHDSFDQYKEMKKLSKDK